MLAGIFAFAGRSSGPDLAWNSGLDSRLDTMEYSVYQEQSEMNAASVDWDYRYSALEDEKLNAGDSV